MTETKQKRKPRKYTDEFKQQLVDLYHSGKRRCDICRESSPKYIFVEFEYIKFPNMIFSSLLLYLL